MTSYFEDFFLIRGHYLVVIGTLWFDEKFWRQNWSDVSAAKFLVKWHGSVSLPDTWKFVNLLGYPFNFEEAFVTKLLTFQITYFNI